MQIININDSYFLKQNDTASEIHFRILGYDDLPYDLAGKRVEVVIGNTVGRILVKEASLLEGLGEISFGLNDGDDIPYGKQSLEVHIYDEMDERIVAPSKGYYQLRIEQTIDDMGVEVTSYTFDFFMDELKRISTIIDSSSKVALDTSVRMDEALVDIHRATVDADRVTEDSIIQTNKAVEVTALAQDATNVVNQVKTETLAVKDSTDTVRQNTEEVRLAALTAKELTEQATTDALDATKQATDAAEIATREADDARAQKELVAQVLTTGPVASVNGKTGLITGLAIQSDVDSLTTQLADKARRADVENLQDTKADKEIVATKIELSNTLADKANKNEVFTMVNMGQDIKVAMTGGGVAVVGENVIDTINYLDGSVSPNKMDSSTAKLIGIDYISFNWVLGQIQSGTINKVAKDRASTENYIELDKDLKVFVKNTSELKFFVFFYTLGGVYTGAFQQITVDTVIPMSTDRKVRFSIGYLDNRPLSSPYPLTQYFSVVKENDLSASELNKRVSDLESSLYDEGSVPVHWVSHLNSKINTINILQKNLGYNGTSFAFITDLHWNDNVKNSPALLQKVMNDCEIPYYFEGGDMASNPLNVAKATQIEEMKDVIKAFKSLEDRCLRALGNHDDNSINNKYSMTIADKEMYDLLYRHNSQYQKFRSGKTGEYYFADDKMHNIRYIVLNCLDIPYVETTNDGLKYTGMGTWAFRQEQIDWFADVALDVPNKEWSAVVCSHVPINQGLIKNDSIMMNILQAFKDKSTYTGTNTTDADFLVNKTVNYAGKGGDVICWIAGHRHKDQFVTMPAHITFPEIVTLNDSKHVDDGQANKTVGTATEQAFDVFTIDKVNRLVNITRIGAGSDRTFTY